MFKRLLLIFTAFICVELSAQKLDDILIDIVKEDQLEKIPWARNIVIKPSENVGYVTSIASRNIGGKYVLATGTKNCISLWDLETLKPVWVNYAKNMGGSVNALIFASDDILYAATGTPSELGKLLIVKKDGLEKIAAADDYFYSMALSPDGKYLASGAFDGTFVIYDTKQKKMFLKVKRPDKKATAIAFSSDSSMMLVGYSDSIIELYSAADGFKSVKKIFSSGGITTGIAFGPKDKCYIASACDDMQECIVTESFDEGMRRISSLKDKKPQGLIYQNYNATIVTAGLGSIAHRSIKSLNRPLYDFLELDYEENQSQMDFFFAGRPEWTWCITQINDNCFAAGGSDGKIFIFKKQLQASPAGVIVLLSTDAKKWLSFVREVYAQGSDPKSFSWIMHSGLPPEAPKDEVFRDCTKIPIFMKSALTGQPPTFKTVWPLPQKNPPKPAQTKDVKESAQKKSSDKKSEEGDKKKSAKASETKAESKPDTGKKP